MSVEVVTFGCRLNTFESEAIRGNAAAAGLSDAIIFNTCAVTAEAERQARQAIRRARKENPHTKIIVTGCSAQVKPELYGAMSEVDHVIGNVEKMKPENYIYRHPEGGQRLKDLTRGTRSFAGAQDDGWGQEKIRVNDIMSVKETANHMVTSFEGMARAFVQVQNGCDHRCTFCIIPYGRGNSRSVAVGEIVTQVRLLIENGYHEIVLTGVDISDYGKDLPGSPTLGQMMRRLLALVPELKRLRLSSIDAAEVDDDVYHLLANEPRFMPHMHVSLQAGDNMILKRMKRRHCREDALRFCHKVRELRPGVVFGADIIAGFPTETEEMFMNTLNLVEEAGLTYLHVFPYSARSGTPAARMPQVAKEIRKERAGRLRELGEKQVQRFYDTWIGREAHSIVEQIHDDGTVTARTEHFAPVKVHAPIPLGTLIPLTITGKSGEYLHGKAA